jgi:hypothetical protein
MGLSIAQVDEIFRENGFAAVQAAWLFRWYEYPSPRYVQEHRIPAHLRAMFYEPRSELQMWVVTWKHAGSYPSRDITEDVFSVADVEDAIRRFAALRQFIAVDQLVRWDDERLAPIRGLVETARSPRQNDRHQAETVIADWLLERGIPF